MIGRRPRSAAEVATDELVVDWGRCVGHGVCAAALGERIDLDRWGYPTGVTTRGVPVPRRMREAAGLAVASCPAAALRLRRTDGA